MCFTSTCAWRVCSTPGCLVWPCRRRRPSSAPASFWYNNTAFQLTHTHNMHTHNRTVLSYWNSGFIFLVESSHTVNTQYTKILNFRRCVWCLFLRQVEFLMLSNRAPMVCEAVGHNGQMLVDALFKVHINACQIHWQNLVHTCSTYTSYCIIQQRSVCTRSQAIGGESPRAVVDNMGDIFMALNRHQFEAVSGWLKSAVERPGFPSQRVTQQSKEQFAKKILK